MREHFWWVLSVRVPKAYNIDDRKPTKTIKPTNQKFTPYGGGVNFWWVGTRTQFDL